MNRTRKSVVPKKKVVIVSTPGKGKSSRMIREGNKDILRENILQCHSGDGQVRRKEYDSVGTRKSISELMTELILNDNEKENIFDMMAMSTDDIRKKPDLWMSAFDNPIDFIEYCRKRLEHERELLESSRQTEEEILQFVQEWTKNTEKHANVLEDLYKVQEINDKLQEVIMEERTHCQHLVGANDQLETQRQIMSRKYQAALLLGKVDEKSVHHLLEKNPKAVPLADRLGDLGRKIKECDGRHRLSEVSDPTVLSGRVQRLEKHVDNLMRQHREEVSVLKETISQGSLKCESIKAQYTDLLQRNSKSLSELKEVLGTTIRENLDLRQELLKRDSEFFDQQTDKMRDRTRKASDRCITSSNLLFKSYSEESTVVERDCQKRLAKSEVDLAKKTNLLRETVGKMVMLERKCARLEEENQVLKKTNEASELSKVTRTLKALKSKNAVLERRCEKTESRLKLGNAGVLHDVRECKTLIKLLVRNVKSFTKEQAQVKKKLLQVNVGVQEPENLAHLQCATTQTNSDIRLHAMNLWIDYLKNKVDSIEEEATSSRANQQDSDGDGLRVIYMNPSAIKRDREAAHKNKNRKLQEKPSLVEVDNMADISSLHSMPPNWLLENRRPSNYAHLLDEEEDAYPEVNTPPPLD